MGNFELSKTNLRQGTFKPHESNIGGNQRTEAGILYLTLKKIITLR